MGKRSGQQSAIIVVTNIVQTTCMLLHVQLDGCLLVYHASMHAVRLSLHVTATAIEGGSPLNWAGHTHIVAAVHMRRGSQGHIMPVATHIHNSNANISLNCKQLQSHKDGNTLKHH